MESANCSVRAGLARLLLSRGIGERVPPVIELQGLLDAGAGSVLKALRELQAQGAVEVVARGRSGTTISGQDVARLWAASEFGEFRVLMPVLGPLEQYGILRFLEKLFRDARIPLAVRHRRGSRERMGPVRAGSAHAAVASVGAATGRGRFGNLEHIDLGIGTYYAPDSLVVVEDSRAGNRTRIRVGIDSTSYDHRELTLAEFSGREVELIECSFVQAPAAVLRGEIDKAVWHRVPTIIPPELAGLVCSPLRSERARRVARIISAAAIVIREDDVWTKRLLHELRVGDASRCRAAIEQEIAALMWDASELFLS